MSHSRKLIAPALFALGVFALAPVATGLTGAIADGNENMSVQAADIAPGGGGEAKNGGDTQVTEKNGGGTGGTDKNGGGSRATDKNGGGTDAADKNGGGNGGGGHHGGMAYGGGSGGYGGHNTITCVINGQIIPVRSVSECRYGPGFVHNGNSYFGGGGFVEAPRYVQRRVIRRRFEANYGYTHQQHYAGPAGGFGGNVGGYSSGESVYIGSNAAVMQAQRRARESGYGVDGGFGGFATYGNNAAYGGGYAKRLRHHRQARGNIGGYRFGGDAGGCGCYEPGYVVHYGPTISKDGGY